MTNSSTTAKHIEWLDIMRVIACFMVVLSHSCDPFVSKFEESPVEFLSGAFWGSMMRASVPLFVIISGALLLPLKDTTEVFYKKRMSRILSPFIIWAVLTPFVYYAYGTITLDKAIVFAYTFPINFNMPTTPFWYIYMLIGLYLIMPVLSTWVSSVSKKGLETFLKIWFITLFLPYIQFFAPAIGYEGNYGNMGILGVCDWNSIGTFHYISGFVGYLLLGHYWRRYPLDWSWGKALAVGLTLFVVGFAITFFGFISVTKNYAVLEVIWYFTNINVFMMVVGSFVILQKVRIPNATVRRIIGKLAYLSFGVYLTHFFVVQVSYDYIYILNLPPYIKIPLIATCAFSVTSLFIYILSKLPKSKYLIG